MQLCLLKKVLTKSYANSRSGTDRASAKLIQSPKVSTTAESRTPRAPRSMSQAPSLPKRKRWTDERIKDLQDEEIDAISSGILDSRVKSESLAKDCAKLDDLQNQEDKQLQIRKLLLSSKQHAERSREASLQAQQDAIILARHPMLSNTDKSDLLGHQKRSVESAEKNRALSYTHEAKRRKLETSDNTEQWKTAILHLTTRSAHEDVLFEGSDRGKCDAHAQHTFRDRSLKHYDLLHPPVHGWCPVFRELFAREDITAAHIVPWHNAYIPQEALGEPNDRFVMSPQNCLPMHSSLEKGWDQATFVIAQKVRTEMDEAPTYYLKVIDKSKFNEKINEAWAHGFSPKHFPKNLAWKDIDGTILKFRNDNRPRRRYLFWKYLTNLHSIAKLGQLLGTVEGTALAIHANSWVSPGCVRTVSLQVLAESAGLPFDMSSGFKDRSPEDKFPHIEPSKRTKESRIADQGVKTAQLNQYLKGNVFDVLHARETSDDE